jgi:hypothetical protein
MHFKRFLLEYEDIDIKLFLKECSDILKSNSELMYRGLKKSSIPEIKLETVRKNRKPVDTYLIIHNLFNKYFQKKFGIPLRSETTFITNEFLIAAGYGTLF